MILTSFWSITAVTFRDLSPLRYDLFWALPEATKFDVEDYIDAMKHPWKTTGTKYGIIPCGGIH